MLRLQRLHGRLLWNCLGDWRNLIIFIHVSWVRRERWIDGRHGVGDETRLWGEEVQVARSDQKKAIE